MPDHRPAAGQPAAPDPPGPVLQGPPRRADQRRPRHCPHPRQVHRQPVLLPGAARLLVLPARLPGSSELDHINTGTINNTAFALYILPLPRISIDDPQDLKGVPRTEAVSITGSLLAFPSVVMNVPLLMPSPDKLTMVSSHELQDQVL